MKSKYPNDCSARVVCTKSRSIFVYKINAETWEWHEQTGTDHGTDIILELCENILQIKPEELQRQWGIERKVSKLIISLYDETTNSTISGKKIADKCLELWDIMFEKQLGSVREISRKLMER